MSASIIYILCLTLPGISSVVAFVSSPGHKCISSAFDSINYSPPTSAIFLSARRQDFYPDYDDYNDDYYYPQPGFREIEESLEQQFRDGTSSRDSGFRFFENDAPRRAAITRINDWEEEYDENDDKDDIDIASGNFWLNPEGDLDSVEKFARQRRRASRPNPSKRNKPTTFRSGYPSVPPPVNELYNRLFWYGIDPDASTTPGDRTMFGGTKGKFNGLSYIKESDGLPRPERRTRSMRRPRSILDSDNDAAAYYDDRGQPDQYDDEDYTEIDEYDYQPQKSQDERSPPHMRRPVTPPYDPPVPRREVRRYSTRQRSQKPVRDSWESSTVAKWFSEEDDDEEEYVGDDRSLARQKRKKKKDGWSAFDMIDAFLGLNRDELNMQAKEYEQRMGIKKEPRTQRRRRERPMSKEPKQSFRYESTEIDEPKVPIYDDVIDTTANSVDSSRITKEQDDYMPKMELSWEERALAIDRVPPADIPAWGPTGELGFDARTKAVMDALVDIAEAKEMVENRKKRVADCREEMTILRIDAELERKRLQESRRNSQNIGEKLRRMDLQMENSARKLRRSQINLKNAKQVLAELEARHWAVLGFYDPDRAGVNVDNALLELKEQEPAVRRIFEKEDEGISSDVHRLNLKSSDINNNVQ